MSELPGGHALVFPGQGSQYVGMGKAAHGTFPEAAQVFEEADDALGISVSSLCFNGDEATLRQTEFTQPAILAVSVALYRVLAKRAPAASFVAGHSLGEFSAFVAAASLDFSSAVRLVRARGQYMQSAVPKGAGAMAAIIGLEDAAIDVLCAQIDGVVEPANYNAPGQVVIAGDTAAVRKAITVAKEHGARRAVPLRVSAPFHCSLMSSAAERLIKDLAAIEFADPNPPVVCNVDGKPIEEGSSIGGVLAGQVTSPVLWSESVRWMSKAGICRYIEVGPGKVLTGLIKRTLKGAPVAAFEGPEGLSQVLALLQHD